MDYEDMQGLEGDSDGLRHQVGHRDPRIEAHLLPSITRTVGGWPTGWGRAPQDYHSVS